MSNGIVLLLSGPNLNLLGEREPEVYGAATLDDHVATARRTAEAHGLVLEHLQSNAEADLVEAIQKARGRCAAIVINPVLQDAVPYDVIKDLLAVSIVGSSPLVLAANPGLPVKSVGELIAYAKANPGKLNFASAGIGTTPHMAGELLKLRIGAQMTHVPYKGMGPAMADLVSGRVQFSFGSITAALPFLQDHRLRGLATTGAKRSGALPDLPTVIEAGLPGFEVDLWLGLFGPARLPPPALARLNAETRKAIEHPDARAAFAKVGVEPRGTSAEEAAAFVRAEHDKWSRVVRDAKLKGAS